jgi:DUF1365 family protein
VYLLLYVRLVVITGTTMTGRHWQLRAGDVGLFHQRKCLGYAFTPISVLVRISGDKNDWDFR